MVNQEPLPIWDTEPMNYQWEHEGMRCHALRSPETYTWCAYVEVAAPGPVNRARAYILPDFRNWEDLTVHGGVTFQGTLPHVHSLAPLVGFDCAHAMDYMPMSPRVRGILGRDGPRDYGSGLKEKYWCLEMVIEETNALAIQVKDILTNEGENK